MSPHVTLFSGLIIGDFSILKKIFFQQKLQEPKYIGIWVHHCPGGIYDLHICESSFYFIFINCHI